MAATKLSRNAKCPCRSGKKVKYCCGDKARTWKPIDFGLFQLAAPMRVTPVAQTIEESPIAHWLIECARRMTLRAMQPDATQGDVLVSLLLTVTAAEAAVNRLLEPLVSRDEWEGTSGLKSVERLRTPEKWEKLSDLLHMHPALRKGQAPLQTFTGTLEARHALVHFKHGMNRKVSEARGPEQILYDVPANIVVDSDLMSRPRTQVSKSPAEEALQPSKAEGYYLSFAALLLPTLNAYPTVDPSLAYAVREMRSALGVTGTEAEEADRAIQLDGRPR